MLSGFVRKRGLSLCPVFICCLLKSEHSTFPSSERSGYFKELPVALKESPSPSTHSGTIPRGSGQRWAAQLVSAPAAAGLRAGAGCASAPTSAAAELRGRGTAEGKSESCKLESLFWWNTSTLQQYNKQNNKLGDVGTRILKV